MIRGNCDLLKLTVNRTKLKCANKSFDLYKSAGPDLTLQQGIDVLSSLLCSMFRASLALGYILTAWTKARVTFYRSQGNLVIPRIRHIVQYVSPPFY